MMVLELVDVPGGVGMTTMGYGGAVWVSKLQNYEVSRELDAKTQDSITKASNSISWEMDKAKMKEEVVW